MDDQEKIARLEAKVSKLIELVWKLSVYLPLNVASDGEGLRAMRDDMESLLVRDLDETGGW